MTAVLSAGFSGRRTSELVGISYRQLDYWARTGILRPTHTDASGSGTRRAYAHRDLLELQIIRTLTDGGVHLDEVRRHVDQLHQADQQALTEGYLLFSRDGGIRFLDDLTGFTSEISSLCAVLPLAPLAKQLDERIAEATA